MTKNEPILTRSMLIQAIDLLRKQISVLRSIDDVFKDVPFYFTTEHACMSLNQQIEYLECNLRMFDDRVKEQTK